MPDFVARIANCLVCGNVLESDGSSKLILCLENRDVELIQASEIQKTTNLRDNFQGKLVPTSTLIIKNVQENDLSDVRDFIFSFCFLMSFITCSQVVFYSQKFPKNSSTWAVVGKVNIYGNVIDFRNGSVVKDFIVTVWDKFRSEQKARRLDMIFDYLHNANYPGSTIESKLVFSFVTLESLKYTFALQNKIPFAKGFFRKPNNSTYGLLELLQKMFAEVDIGFNNKTVIKSLRDEIIHSGLSQKDFSYNFNVYREVQNLIRNYLCALIGYNKKILSI